jgi:hypothetical protein
MAILQIEVHVALTSGDDAQAVVIDDKRCGLLDNQLEHTRIAMNHYQLVAEIYAVANFVIVRGKDFLHPP